MDTKHTPGPWRKVKCQCGFEGCNQYFVEPIRGTDGRFSEADADLVVAAPELLDLAKEALAQLEKMDFTLSANWNGSLKTNIGLLLSAAIAKAEGR